MARITIKQLSALCDRLNRLTGSPMHYWAGDDIQVGHWHIDCAYDGYSLVRTCNQSGGVSQPMGWSGHVPARELYEQMSAFIAGIEFARSMGA